MIIIPLNGHNWEYTLFSDKPIFSHHFANSDAVRYRYRAFGPCRVVPGRDPLDKSDVTSIRTEWDTLDHGKIMGFLNGIWMILGMSTLMNYIELPYLNISSPRLHSDFTPYPAKLAAACTSATSVESRELNFLASWG